MGKGCGLESEKISTKANSLNFQYFLIVTILVLLLSNHERRKKVFCLIQSHNKYLILI